MATYVNDLRLKEIGTGESSGTWGTETNTNLELIAEAFSFGTEAITTNADTHTTTIADGSTDPGRSLYLKYTGTLDSACTITIGPNTVSKLWFIENGTSGSQNIIISQGSGANITIPPGDVKAVYSDGAGSGAAVVDVFASLNVVDLKVQDDLTVTDDATVGGTLGVTGIVTLTDDLIIGDGKTIGSASDVDAMTIASNGQVTFSQTLIGTALDISGDIDVDGTTNLDVVDIDGAVDMATTLTLAGNADFNGDLDVDGTTNLDVVDIDGAVDMASTLAVGGATTVTQSSAATAATFKVGDNSAQVANVVVSNDADTGLNLGVFGSSAGTAGMISASDAFITTSTTELNVGVNNSSGVIKFGVGSTAAEKMRIDSSGNLLVGKTSGTSGNKIETDGRISAGAGSTGQPTFNCEGDTNTGINLPESDRIQFITGGTEAIRIDSSQKVGIGTSSPSEKLHVQGDGADILITDAGGGEMAKLGATGSNNGILELKNSSHSSTVFLNTSGDSYLNGGSVGIGTASPASLLSLQGDAELLRLDGTANTTRTIFFRNTTAANPAQIHSDGSLKLRAEDSGTHMEFHTVDTERMRIDSSGRLLVGSTTAVATTSGTGAAQVLGTGNSDSTFTLGRFSDSTGVASLNFVKSRNGTIGSNTIVQDGDSLGSLVWAAADGSDFVSHAAKIDARIDGTPGANDTPGRLSFYTTADGSDSAVERMRIDSSGNVAIATTTATEKLTVNGALAITGALADDRTSTGAMDFSSGVTRFVSYGASSTDGIFAFRTAQGGASSTERMRIDGSGHVLIGTTSNQGVGGISFQHGSTGVNIQQNMDGTSGGAELYVFRRNSTQIGSINQSSTNAVTYNTSSDARLKDVTGSSRGLDVINNLNPVAYNWKADNHADEGLIAQEVEELVPNAVNQGEDGYYSMDYSKLVTHLVKGMQEQQEQIESLKSEIANLKEN